ncbi:hypothetical protein BCR37DRAFT_254928 [Protomyces lactucae-debilis]|uniref:Uncharacterized protein n=1 Tax=Protomyces lactucae-debilis TaxID=2754530 RepID=A0A1Y2FLR2_PROLT|nr:uncharacterized protein BCR37DRAFT_254928 [Protomyces lactucae-debilis]ORY84931.1 hypothetical protein BCR37DRAFT_254928 [Protomyces lactucae-debilis]
MTCPEKRKTKVYWEATTADASKDDDLSNTHEEANRASSACVDDEDPTAEHSFSSPLKMVTTKLHRKLRVPPSALFTPLTYAVAANFDLGQFDLSRQRRPRLTQCSVKSTKSLVFQGVPKG